MVVSLPPCFTTAPLLLHGYRRHRKAMGVGVELVEEVAVVVAAAVVLQRSRSSSCVSILNYTLRLAFLEEREINSVRFMPLT